MSKPSELLGLIAATTTLASCDWTKEPQTNQITKVAASVPTGGTCDIFKSCSATGDYCKKPIGTCNIVAVQGVCTPRPTEVTYDIRPVCGCDGKTYTNLSYAAANGVNVKATGECPPEPPQNVPLPSVQIVPKTRDSATKDYCRLESRPGGWDLVVRLRNPSPLNKPSMNVSVGFAGTPPSTVQAPSPAIGPGSTVDMRFAVPSSCLTGDCGFIIKAFDPSGGVQAQGSCLG